MNKNKTEIIKRKLVSTLLVTGIIDMEMWAGYFGGHVTFGEVIDEAVRVRLMTGEKKWNFLTEKVIRGVYD